MQANRRLSRLAIDDGQPVRRAMPVLCIPGDLLDNRAQPSMRQPQSLLPLAELKLDVDSLGRAIQQPIIERTG
jgi:hypothetical protein